MWGKYMIIEKPWEEYVCDECYHRFQEDMCNAYMLGNSYAYCPQIRNCEKFKRNKSEVKIYDLTRHVWNNRWAVVGFDYDTAKQLIASIEESSGKEMLRKMRTKNEMRTEFTDGTLLKWVKASESSRGQKFGKMWCDKNINEDIFKCVIMPMYFGKREDIIWI